MPLTKKQLEKKREWADNILRQAGGFDEDERLVLKWEDQTLTVEGRDSFSEETIISVSELPGCCGIAVVHDFSDSLSQAEFFEAGMIVALLQGNVFEGSAILATTIPSQTHAIQALKNLGFEKVHTSLGLHTNKITTWIYKLNRKG